MWGHTRAPLDVSPILAYLWEYTGYVRPLQILCARPRDSLAMHNLGTLTQEEGIWESDAAF